jgi:ATP-dependent protease ClpP protease subunit
VPRRPLAQDLRAQVGRLLTARRADAGPARPEGQAPNLTLASNGDSGPAVLRIYDAIGGWWGITAQEVAELLDDLGADRALEVRINSPGGDVFEATAIYNLLVDRAGPVDVIVDGLAASAASFISMAGDTVTMNRGTQFMIHDALGLTIGNAGEHRLMAELLDRVSDAVADIYQARAGGSVATWRERMRAETWYSAVEAVDAGLADSHADTADDDQDQTAAAVAVWDATASFTFAGRHLAPAPSIAAPDAAPAAPSPAAEPDVAAAVRALKGAFVHA